jgi:hypothetical protein
MLKQAQILGLTAWRAARPALRAGADLAWLVIKTLWSVIRPALSFLLQVAAALVLIFEEWGWKPLSEALAALSRFRLVGWLESKIASLPPYAALLTIALPTAILLPLKLLSVWLLANGYFLSAGALFIGAKIASTALIARIFMLTRPALMKIGWFARAYNRVMPWKDRLFATIRESYTWRYGRMLKTTLVHESKQAWARWKPWLRDVSEDWRPRAIALAHQARVGARILRQTLWRTWRPRLSGRVTGLRERGRQLWQLMIGIG